MAQETLTFAQVTKDPLTFLRAHPGDALALRSLHTALTTNLSSLHKKHDFLAALLYKHIIEDILSNTAEDDYIDQAYLLKLTASLLESWDYATSDGDSAGLEQWLTHLVAFAGQYRNLPSARRVADTVALKGLSFLVASGEDPLVGPPIAPEDSDPTMRLFPNIDESLTNYRTGVRLMRWYAEEIRRVRRTLKHRGSDLGCLCFIEKPYSGVGALSMTGYLVSQLRLPAVYYRSGYWDPQNRLSGTIPQRGSTAVLVYDVAIQGSLLIEASHFLNETLDVHVGDALVLYDFSCGAQDSLTNHDIQLTSFLERTAIAEDLSNTYAYTSALYDSHDKFRIMRGEKGLMSLEQVDAEVRRGLQEAISIYRRITPLSKH